MPKKHDLPAMPFYVGDWLKCPEVRALSLEARAIWFDMLCYMWESTERGYLTINKKPIPEKNLAQMLGVDEILLKQILSKLQDFAVYSLRDDGAIYCRKMVKNEDIRLKRAYAGHLGGICSSKIQANGQANGQAKGKHFTEDENETEDEDVNVEEDREKESMREREKEIIDDLNNVCKTSFKYTTRKTRSLIQARMNEGFTVDDFKLVHRKKAYEWQYDNKMVKFLRPETLYSNKFEGYLNQKEVKDLTEAQIKTLRSFEKWNRRMKNEEENV